MKLKKRINQGMTIIFMIFLIGLMTLNVITEDKEISVIERRKLKTLPKFSIESFMDGSYMSEIEKHALDQMYFRETFRKIKGNVDFYIFQKKDVDDIFVYNNHLVKLEYPYNPQSVENFNNYIKQITDRYLSQSNVYISIIPDKAYFVQDDRYPRIDYEMLQFQIKKHVGNMSYINLFEQLALEDYYYTDTHWKQENLLEITSQFGEIMKFDTSILKSDYIVKTYNDFTGVYYSQTPLKVPKDDLHYLYSENMSNVFINNFENLEEKNSSIYDLEKLDSLDPYNVFLSGASPLIEIDNPNNTTGKELIIFRDSFASSLAPLLLQGYSKMTLIDTRYMSYKDLDELIDFTGQDVLFLYNTAVVNNSQMLR